MTCSGLHAWQANVSGSTTTCSHPTNCKCSCQNKETLLKPSFHTWLPDMLHVYLPRTFGLFVLLMEAVALHRCLRTLTVDLILEIWAITLPSSFINSNKPGNNRWTPTLSLTLASPPISLSFPQCMYRANLQVTGTSGPGWLNAMPSGPPHPNPPTPPFVYTCVFI